MYVWCRSSDGILSEKSRYRGKFLDERVEECHFLCHLSRLEEESLEKASYNWDSPYPFVFLDDFFFCKH
jgi:hypothetical protein